MTKAIIFDCFGVLTTEAWLPFKAKYFGHDPEVFKQASQLSWQANGGEISYEEFMRGIAKLAGITPAEAVKAIERNVPDEGLFAYIDELKQYYKLGLLSNMADDRLARIFTPKQLRHFDIITLSFQTGFIKPERQAFAAAAEQLGVDADECIFIDDLAHNVVGAQQAGMMAILYQDVAQLRHELGELLKS
ncbi:MAG TPA: HAD family phosphatase [Candidatus Saccharimonadales bacterium]